MPRSWRRGGFVCRSVFRRLPPLCFRLPLAELSRLSLRVSRPSLRGLRLLLTLVLALPAASAGRADLRQGAQNLDQQRGRAARPQRRGDPRAACGQHGRRLDWVRLDEVSPAFVADRRSAPRTSASTSTAGWTGWRWAMPRWTTCSRRRTRGASTLSMQVAAMLEAEPQDAAAATARSDRNGTRSRPRASWRSSGASGRFSRPT